MNGFMGQNHVRKYFEFSFMKFMEICKYDFINFWEIFLSKYVIPKNVIFICLKIKE